MKRLVADTGPLLHLHEADALHLLPLIGQTEIAPLVLTEIRFHAPNFGRNNFRLGRVPKPFPPPRNNAPANGKTPDCSTAAKLKPSLLLLNRSPTGFSPTTPECV